MRRPVISTLLACVPFVANAQVIRDAGAPKYAGIATLRQESSVGAVDGPEAYLLGNITELAIAPNGAVYAFDRTAMTIRKYDASGRFIRRIGQRGDGPGDFGSPAGLAVLADGRLLVWDTKLARVSVFDSNGVALAQWPAPGQTSSGGSRGLVLDAAGNAYARRLSVEVPQRASADARPDIRFKSVWLEYRTRDGALVDSITEPDLPPVAEPFRAQRGRSIRQMAMPFLPRRFSALTPAGHVVSAIGERYGFDVIVGPSATRVQRGVTATPIAQAARDSARTMIETSMTEVDPTWTWPAGRELPRVMPLVVDLLVGDDGRIWLQRDRDEPQLTAAGLQRRAGRSGAGASMNLNPGADVIARPTHFDVFESGGGFVGQVEFPPRVTPMVMRGDLLWAIARSEDDVQFIRRYRIVWK